MFVNATSSHIPTASSHYSYITQYFSTLSQYIATKTLPTHENKGTESCSHDLSSCTRSRRDIHDQYIAKNNEFPARIKTRNTVASLFFSLSLSPSLLLIPRGISIRH